MNGFIIDINGNTLCVRAEENSRLFIMVNQDNDRQEGDSLHVRRANFQTKEKCMWHDYTRIVPGDIITIQMTEVEKEDMPVSKEIDESILSPQEAKLEGFRQLETYLKERGML